MHSSKISRIVFLCLISLSVMLPVSCFAQAAAADKCEPLPPFYRSDSSNVVMEKIGPNAPDSPTANTYFFMPHKFHHVVVHLKPTTSDVGTYVVKLQFRHSDDTIYEPIVEAIVPTANKDYTWGPIEAMDPKVPKDKFNAAFNVKVQENYLLEPKAKGFSYTVSVDGCN